MSKPGHKLNQTAVSRVKLYNLPADYGLLGVSSEGQILAVMRQAVENGSLEPAESFFKAGGDSAATLWIASQLRIEPSLLHAYPSARKLSTFLKGRSHPRENNGDSRTSNAPSPAQ